MSDCLDCRNHFAVTDLVSIPTENCKLPIQWRRARKIKLFSRCGVYWDGPAELSDFKLSQKSWIEVSSRWMVHKWEGQFCASQYFESDSLISVLACLVHSRPDTIRRCFASEKHDFDSAENSALSPISYANEEYITRLWLNGKWRRLRFDDKLPCRFNGQHLSSCTVSIFEYFPWVAFIEKAVATAIGGFDLIRRACFESAARQVQICHQQRLLFCCGVLYKLRLTRRLYAWKRMITGGYVTTVDITDEDGLLWQENGHLWFLLQVWPIFILRCPYFFLLTYYDPARVSLSCACKMQNQNYRVKVIVSFFQFWISERRPLCCTSKISSLIREGYNDGILPGKGYPITGCCELEKNGQKLKLLKIAQPFFQEKIPSCAYDWPYFQDSVDCAGNKGFEDVHDINPSFFWMRLEDWCQVFTKGLSSGEDIKLYMNLGDFLCTPLHS
jgi:hypothetical protein